MRVLISGVTSDLGRLFARAALGAGHEVIGVGAEPSRYLPPGVSLTVGDAATAAELVPRCDVLVHLMPIEREVPESGGIPALRTLATAAARHGVRFIAPLAHGPDASDAERVVHRAGGPHVVVRAAPLGGRLLDWHACRTIATLLSAPKDTQWRLLHHDDLVRFLLYAIAGERTGVVPLASPGVVLAGRARELLRAATPTPSGRGIPSWPDMSTSDRKGSAQDWGFECGWTTTEVVLDLARGAQGRRTGRDGGADRLARLPIPTESLPRYRPPEDGTALASIALPSMAVELDDRIDPRFPVYTVDGVVEAFPGPLTPLSIDVHSSGLRATNRVLGRVMGLRGELADEWEGRGHAVFGHRMYVGVSAGAATAAMVPGLSEKKVLRKALGEDKEPNDHERPALPTGPRKWVAKVAALTRFLRVANRFKASVRDFAAGAEAEHVDDAALDALTDAALATRALLLRDRIQHGWVLSGVGTHLARLTGAPLVWRAKGDPAALGKGEIEVEPTVVTIDALAELLRADEDLLALAGWGDVSAVRSRSPEFAAAFDDALTRIGHRGPGETELSNQTFAQRPELVLNAAAAAARKPVPEPVKPEEPKDEPEPEESTQDSEATEEPAESTSEEESADQAEVAEPPVETPAKVKRGILEKIAIAGQRRRETARDATMRYTNELRRLVHEWGRRHVHNGQLAEVTDVHYLTLDELLTLPPNTRDTVAGRRVEHERLTQIRMPETVYGSWRPETTTASLTKGEQLTGLGASAGVVEGRVRLVAADAQADLGSGEAVLVTRVADVGHAALFRSAAAVVTDLGDTMSRAAIVARTVGVPCVANTKDASVRLTSGALIRVDGTAGTIEILESAPSPLPAGVASQ